jgi:hypothetical protein
MLDIGNRVANPRAHGAGLNVTLASTNGYSGNYLDFGEMQGPRSQGSYEGRLEDCRAAIMPLLDDYLSMHHGRIADAKPIEVIILPAARAAGCRRET